MVQKTVWKKHIGILPIFLAYKLKIKKKNFEVKKKKFKFFPTILLSNTFLKKLLNWQHRAISFSAGVNSVSLWVWSSGFLVQSLVLVERTWVWVSSNVHLSSLKQLKVGYIWVRSNTKVFFAKFYERPKIFFSKQYKYRCIFFDILTIFCSNASGIGIIRWSLTIMKFFWSPTFVTFFLDVRYIIGNTFFCDLNSIF